MRLPAVICFLTLSVSLLPAQSVEPGAGAPTEYVRNLFVSAYNRASFSRLAALPAATPVRRYGSTGLIQEFNDSTRSSGRLALIRASDTGDSGEVYQVLTDVFAYYSTVGVGTAGYPLSDTRTCPSVACTWQVFDLRYALFSYSSGANITENITVRDPFYTRWEALGGITRMGPPLSAEASVTGYYGGAATMQRFSSGVIFDITAGTLTGRTVGVRAPVFDLYTRLGGHTGSLGYPMGDEQMTSSGRRRQSFEGGSIEYDDSGVPVLRPPVNSILLTPSATPVKLNAGETLTLEATLLGSDSSRLTDRQVNWTTTNSRVASIQANGTTAVIRAAGAGTARITATSEGKTSAPIDVTVSSQCCGVGEGAPGAAIQQAFQEAIARTRIQITIPGPDRVRRAGAGYVQEFQGAGTPGLRYLLAISDRSAQAYVVSGPVLTRYEELGGPASSLGFPTSDASASGRQVFEGGALAGSPVRVVAGAILARWATSGYETGPAGPPVAEAGQATSFSGTAGQLQQFATAVIGGTSRTAFLVPASAAQHYLALEGALGVLGFPTADETVVGTLHRQEFEGGSLEYTAGSSDARAITRERKPSAAVVPSSVLPGSRVRVTLSGFPDGSTLRITVTGQPEFQANASVGSFSWEFLVPPGATAGTVRIRAADQTGASAEAAYTIRTLAEARVQLVKIAGDTQSGSPGALLANPLRIALRDDAGNPVSGATVRFTASPGALAVPDSAVTDSSGIAETRLRLPNATGPALITAEAARQVVTFSALAAGASITSFPRLMQTGTDAVGNGSATIAEAGALLASAASLLSYYQTRGELGSPNGEATVGALNDFLRRNCTTDMSGSQVCDGFLAGPTGGSIANLARIGQFTGGAVAVSTERPELANITSLVAAGTPVLIALRLSSQGRTGSHFVVAIGLANDGGLLIHDPDPVLARTRLDEYIAGFTAGDFRWQASISGALRIIPARSPGSAFLVHTAASGIRVQSPSGDCGFDFVLADQPARSTVPAGMMRFRTCEGTAQEYQLELDGDGTVRGSVIDMTEGGSRIEVASGGTAAFRLSRTGGRLTATPQTASLSSSGVLNSASFTPEIAVGGLISIFGSGLARTGRETKVSIGGRNAQVVAAMPFQLNAQIPFETAPGIHTLRVETPWSNVERSVEIRPVAPAAFRSDGRAIVVNQDGILNSPANPASRGETVVLYVTGLGAVSGSDDLRPVVTPVKVVLRDQEMRVSYAGLTPGLVGLYQINFVISSMIAPGIDISLTLRQGSVEQRSVEISVF